MVARTQPVQILLLGSILLLAATLYLVGAFGRTAYFVFFHQPLNISFSSGPKAYAPPALPKFVLTHRISSPQVSLGGTENVNFNITSNTSVESYLKVWITAPDNKEVFKSNISLPEAFKAGQAITRTFSYSPTVKAPSGTYRVSVILASLDQKTDYYVSENFAKFELVQ